MDPRTGEIHYVESEKAARERGLIPVRRDLSQNERRAMRIGPNSPCGCGSGKKLKKCCKTS